MQFPAWGQLLGVHRDVCSKRRKGHKLKMIRAKVLKLCGVKSAPISDRMLSARLDKLQKECQNRPAQAKELQQLVQSGILDPDATYQDGAGFIAPPPPTAAAPDASAAAAAHTAADDARTSSPGTPNLEDPHVKPRRTESLKRKKPILREVTDGLAHHLRRRDVGPKLTALVDLASIKVYVAQGPVAATKVMSEFKKGKVPDGCLHLHGNFAIWRYSNGKYKLLLIVVEHTAVDDPEDADAAAALTVAFSDLFKAGILECTAASRVGLNGEMMMVYGLRLSQNYRAEGDPVTLHVREKQRVESEEAAGKYVASRAIDLLVRRYFSGAMDEMRDILAEKGCPFTATTGYPFTAACVTFNYFNGCHVDAGDCAPTITFWLHKGEVANGGKFVLPGLRAWFEPKHTTVMWMEATEVHHHTIAPPQGACSPGSGVVGVSLAIHGEVIPNLRTWEAKLAVAAEDDYKFVEEAKMGQEWRRLPGFKRCLTRFPVRGTSRAAVAAAAAVDEREEKT